MLRSPISPASFCTFARSSSRNTISSGESGPALETFFPGILIRNHQSNTKMAATAMVMRRTLGTIFQSMRRAPTIRADNYQRGRMIAVSRELFPEPQRAETEQQDRHDDLA